MEVPGLTTETVHQEKVEKGRRQADKLFANSNMKPRIEKDSVGKRSEEAKEVFKNNTERQDLIHLKVESNAQKRVLQNPQLNNTSPASCCCKVEMPRNTILTATLKQESPFVFILLFLRLP